MIHMKCHPHTVNIHFLFSYFNLQQNRYGKSFIFRVLFIHRSGFFIQGRLVLIWDTPSISCKSENERKLKSHMNASTKNTNVSVFNQVAFSTEYKLTLDD